MADHGASKLRRLRAALSRRALHLIGLAVVLPLVAVDPVAIVLVYDVEFLTLTASAGLALLRGDARAASRAAWTWVRDTQPVRDLQAGIALTRQDPRSLLHA